MYIFNIYMTTYENLVYPTLDSYDSIQNIVFIDQSVTQSQVFYDSANAASYPILYNSLTKREDLSQLLSRFTHLDRIAFVFHGIYPGCYYDKPFLEEQPFFILDVSGAVIVSENVSFVQTLISTFTVAHVDFLGCNLLLSEEWLKYFDVLSVSSVIGASNDNTGNLKYGGDWILENTMEDVQNTYFTSQIEDLTTTLVGPLYPLNTYNHTFYTYSSATPTILTQTVYNAAGVQQSVTDMSFGGQNIQTVLTALDVAPYTVGIRDTSNNKVSMDLAFFGAYNTTLTTTQQNNMITYVNTNYKEPRTAATNYAVTVSGGVFNIDGVAQPNLTFVSGNLYVFDQSSPTNIGNLLVLGTTADVSSSIVGNNVVYNGTPGSANAYTLIDFGGTNPATTSLYYFSLTTTGLGYTPPTVKYVVGAVSANMSAANGGFPGLVTTNTNTLFYSYDGITWTGLGQTIFDLVCLTVAYGNGVWVAGGMTSGNGSANDMAYSTDGINWTGLGIKFSAGVGYDNFATTSDLYFWGNGCLMVRYLGGYFVAVGQDYVSIVYSTNGINWTKVALPTTKTNYGATQVITYTGSNWFVICYSEIFRSSNLATWTSIHQTGEGGVGANGSEVKNGSDYQLMTTGLLLSTINNTVSAVNSAAVWLTASTGASIGYIIFGGYGSTIVALNTMNVNYVTGSMPSDVGTIAFHVYNNNSYVGQFSLFLPSSTKIYNVHNISFDTNLNKWIFAGDQGVMYKNTNTFSTSTEDCAVTLLSTPTGAYTFGLGCKYIGARTY